MLPKKTKEKIITECHAWSVDYMNKMMDKLILEARQEGKEEVIRKIEKELYVKEDDEDEYMLVGRLLLFLRELKPKP